ncbi:hypothetical protein IKE79_01890 [Candidatus Saccharibacteria bacterium]|nr:hypothetical protein [Candidatus Saccharibacteria bacterium]
MDSVGLPAMRSVNAPATNRSKEEMHLCEFTQGGYCRISEMWTTDFFRIRKIVNLDDSGFFTALLVMCTLLVHGHWYNWREADYREAAATHS